MDFNTAVQMSIKTFTQPGEASFEEAKQSPANNFSTAIVVLMIALGLAAIISLIAQIVLTFLGFGGFNIPPEFIASLEQDPSIPPDVIEFLRTLGQPETTLNLGFIAISVGGAVITALTSFIVFFIISGLHMLVASLFSGQGSFAEQTTMLAIYSAPLYVVNALLGAIPVVNICAAVILFVYYFVLTYFALKVTHKFEVFPALITTIAPTFIILVCAFGCILAFITVFAGIAAGTGA